MLPLSLIIVVFIHGGVSHTFPETQWEEGVELLWQLYGVPVTVYEMICRSCVTEVAFTQRLLLL